MNEIDEQEFTHDRFCDMSCGHTYQSYAFSFPGKVKHFHIPSNENQALVSKQAVAREIRLITKH